jgi:hypothetical protein
MWAGCALAILLVVSGCKGRGGKSKARRDSQALETNIISVHAYTDAMNCWIWNEDRSEVRGIIVKAMYLEGPDGGVFGDGIIRPKLFAAHYDDQGKRQWRQVEEWSFDVEQAKLWRTKEKFLPGWGYRLHLPWSEDLKLSGREVRLVVEFERKDGIVVRSAKTDRKVPVTGS